MFLLIRLQNDWQKNLKRKNKCKMRCEDMAVKMIEEYLNEMNIKADEVFTKEEAVKLVNEHVISLYKGRIKLGEDKEFTGYELADKLHTIHAWFVESFEKAVKEFEEEEE